MADSVQTGLVDAAQVARESVLLKAPNGIQYASYGETGIPRFDLARMVQAVPATIANAISRKAYYFVPLAMSDARVDNRSEDRAGSDIVPTGPTMIASAYTAALGDQAICHRNVPLDNVDGVFISTRLLSDRFALAFEFFINIGHAFVDSAGVSASFADLVWCQAVADVRGETSQDAWENRGLALSASPVDGKPRIDERARNDYLDSAFSDAIAIYLLSLAVDFDYSELREREYPLLAPQALAERLRHVAGLFPPNPNYEFAVRYRRRA